LKAKRESKARVIKCLKRLFLHLVLSAYKNKVVAKRWAIRSSSSAYKTAINGEQQQRANVTKIPLASVAESHIYKSPSL